MAKTDKNNSSSSGKSNSGKSKLLDKVLSGITDEYLPAVRQGLIEQASEEEQRIIEPMFDTLEEQMSEVTGQLKDKNQDVPPRQVEEINQFLKSAAAPQLLSAGKDVARDMSTRQAKTGQSDIFDLLKKLIKKIPELFGGSLPSWFSDLLDVINELKNQVFSVGSMQLSHELSRRHQDYLKELTQVERLKQAQQARLKSNDDNGNGG